MDAGFWALAGIIVSTGGAIWIQLLNTRRQDGKRREELASNLVKTNEMLTQIHVLVNSRLDEALTEIAELKKQVAGLR